eukprot:gene2992-138_t
MFQALRPAQTAEGVRLGDAGQPAPGAAPLNIQIAPRSALFLPEGSWRARPAQVITTPRGGEQREDAVPRGLVSVRSGGGATWGTQSPKIIPMTGRSQGLGS